MKGWTVRTKFTDQKSAVMLPTAIDTVETNSLFLWCWEWQVKDNGASEDTEVTLTVKELRRVAAFWTGLGTGMKIRSSKATEGFDTVSIPTRQP